MKSFVNHIGFISAILLLLMFFGCDGRDRMFKTNKEVLIESKLLESFSKNVSYIPETYNEIEVDTLLHNGYTVRIKHFTDMGSDIVHKTITNDITYEHRYRNTVADITVHRKGKLIFNRRIKKDLFVEKDSDLSEEFNHLVLNSVYVDDFPRSDRDGLIINFCLGNPNTKNQRFYSMEIDRSGTHRLFENKPDTNI